MTSPATGGCSKFVEQSWRIWMCLHNFGWANVLSLASGKIVLKFFVDFPSHCLWLNNEPNEFISWMGVLLNHANVSLEDSSSYQLRLLKIFLWVSYNIYYIKVNDIHTLCVCVRIKYINLYKCLYIVCNTQYICLLVFIPIYVYNANTCIYCNTYTKYI